MKIVFRLSQPLSEVPKTLHGHAEPVHRRMFVPKATLRAVDYSANALWTVLSWKLTVYTSNPTD
jgi:hypothetical protein